MARTSVVTDDFSNPASGNLTGGTGWTNMMPGYGQINTTNGKFGDLTFTGRVSYHKTGTVTANQYSEVAISGFNGGTGQIGAVCRGTSGTDNGRSCYAVIGVVYDSTQILTYIVRLSGDTIAAYLGANGASGTLVAWSDGDKLSLEVTGTGTVTLKSFKNATGDGTTGLIDSGTDSSGQIDAAGSVGIYAKGVNTMLGDSFSGGNIGASEDPTKIYMRHRV